MPPDLAIFGNLLLDDVVYADGRTRMGQPGGATLHAALAARLWGVAVGIVSVVGSDYPLPVLEALAERGIDLAGVRRLGTPGLRTWLLYEGRRRRVVHRLEGPSHEEVSPRPDDLPGSWRPRLCHLAPMPFAVQLRLVERLAARSGVGLSLDPFDLFERAGLERWRPLLARVDLLFLSEDELLLEGAERDPEAALRELAAVGGGGRPGCVVLKQGAAGGRALAGGRSHAWAPRAAAVVDPTGAGDAFAAGLLAGRLLGEPMERALQRAVVSASFALEGRGADGLLAAGPEAARRRLEEWFEAGA